MARGGQRAIVLFRLRASRSLWPSAKTKQASHGILRRLLLYGLQLTDLYPLAHVVLNARKIAAAYNW
jgi:hypothetical protein